MYSERHSFLSKVAQKHKTHRPVLLAVGLRYGSDVDDLSSRASTHQNAEFDNRDNKPVCLRCACVTCAKLYRPTGGCRNGLPESFFRYLRPYFQMLQTRMSHKCYAWRSQPSECLDRFVRDQSIRQRCRPASLQISGFRGVPLVWWYNVAVRS